MTVTESWLRVLVGNLRAGVLLEDQQRRILLANQAFCDLFGVGAPPESLVGGDCAGLAAAPLFADPDAFLTRVDEILTRGQPVLGEVLAMADGRRVERNYQPVEVDGVVVGRLWQYRDVTKQHRAAEALRDFLAHVSHEIRTPLNAILGLTEVVLGGELEGGVRAHLDRVHSNAEALHGLISDILDLSKVEAGQMDLEAVELDPEAVIGAAIGALTLRAEEKRLALVFDCRSGTTTLRGDPGRLRQVVTNLLGNAIRYTHQGEVRVSVQLDADPRSGFATLKLAVTDTGPGIPEHELEGIFERFHRANTTGGGAGLGLAITRTLVRSMGGRIEVRSRVGVGSRFVVRIPLPIVSWQDSSRRSLASRRLLVIDDHPERLAATARLLESAGAEVLACDGGAALDAIASDEPLHTVLVDRDVSLPDTLARLVARARPDASLVLLDAAGRPLEGDAFPQRVLRPLTERGLAEIAGAATPAVSHVVGGPLAARVLVVDDASDGRLLARGLLEQAGLRVVEAASGEEAVAIAARQPVDVVLMDVSMPGIGGIEAARRIRARPGAPPVVALTAHATDAVRQSCQAAGMDGFVTKPITGRRLLAAVAEHASLGPAVLVVDDDPDARRLTAAWLGTVPGLRLIEAVTGEQAVELARSRDFDVVLMDLELPGIGGEEATKRIHALPGRSDLPILGLTAHSGSEVRRRCVAAGMCDQVSKPLRREELVRVVCAVAGLSVVASHRVVDPDIADLVPAYLDARRSDLAALEADLDAGRYDAVARLGHQLKGTGAPFGFPEITEIGGRLEQAALARDSTTVLHAARELGRVLGRA